MIRKLLAAAALAAFASLGHAVPWADWDTFKTVSVSGGRVIDYSDERAITTSEGQSYALFFALVADDRAKFAELLEWTENNLAAGDLMANYPAWLWGRDERNAWTVLDTNNAVDSDMWIAYSLLEASRLWGDGAYRLKALAMLELLKTQVRDLPNIGKVLLPGRIGFERDNFLKLNPSYYPLFLIRRFAMEDDYWKEVFEGSLRVVLRSAPAGFSPDWALFDKQGNVIPPSTEDDMYGSYNAIRVYLWAGMTSPKDATSQQLRQQFKPMVRATEELNLPPEKVDVVKQTFNRPGPDYFGACLLAQMGSGKAADFIRTTLQATPLAKDSYYRNVLTLFALGFDQRLFGFDVDGRVVFPKSAAAGDAQ